MLSYELGVTLDASHLEAMLRPCGTSAIVQIKPQPAITIITEFYSNYHDWKSSSLFESMMCPWKRVASPSSGPNGVEKVLPIERLFGFDNVRSYESFFVLQ